MSEWLELELAQTLRPADAPDELWARVKAAGQRPAPRLSIWPALIAACFTIVAAVGALWSYKTLDLRQLAVQALLTHRSDLRSSDPQAIGAWMRAQGFDPGLPSCVPASVSLTGARIIVRHGVRIGAIDYRVNGRKATMLVGGGANFPGVRAAHGNPEWRAQGQVYALAFSDAGDARMACVLCHTSL